MQQKATRNLANANIAHVGVRYMLLPIVQIESSRAQDSSRLMEERSGWAGLPRASVVDLLQDKYGIKTQ